jgi:hypothetical protein
MGALTLRVRLSHSTRPSPQVKKWKSGKVEKWQKGKNHPRPAAGARHRRAAGGVAVCNYRLQSVPNRLKWFHVKHETVNQNGLEGMASSSKGGRFRGY